MSNLLTQIIQEKIQQHPQRQITFADYMELALYHPQYGYYAANVGKIGAQGDFMTSPHLGADFGEMLAVQFIEIWEILGHPTPFHLVEMGAGQGLIAADVIKYLYRHNRDCFAATEYLIIEQSPAMRQLQQQQFSKLSSNGANLRWVTWEEIEKDSITGCFFSNELIDAFPVHQIQVAGEKLQEIYITTSDKIPESPEASPFQEITGELSTPKLTEYFQWIDIDITGKPYPDGYRTEVNLAALDWVRQVSEKLKQGYVLTIDYGYPAHRYYTPTRHQGTLQCYYQHRYHNNPYILIGEQDITAHVDFTALERFGESWGLEKLGFTQQAMFLMALGLGDRIAALSTTPGMDLGTMINRRQVLHEAIDPRGLGGFGVLIQGKGLSEDQKGKGLKGLRIPPMQ
ncbi:class I SAM-dependent methyltransferase [Laspinema olomoucense]|uniref:class I SAM-dependent methyltransferase n=1 Tax=Laspinema olomoucense TaxID=3231600 RepID=UPI0021BB4EEC|nr:MULTISPECIES: class I SAM-dependent methyltransferase [unclassified Laspinema]MCT7991087.1 class I SAM-dependent methyltransferase [Laspinema sp. D3a]MCT7997031.1 class I SAM-dependent methyltransferase [Laspinema sp. D3c]